MIADLRWEEGRFAQWPGHKGTPVASPSKPLHYAGKSLAREGVERRGDGEATLPIRIMGRSRHRLSSFCRLP